VNKIKESCIQFEILTKWLMQFLIDFEINR